MKDSIASLTAALADRYRIEHELGQGGMATVYLAHDLRHDRQVAIKVLHEDLGATLGPERFLAEIKTTARLQHPHILPLLDSGEADGLLFYVMPFISGESLRDRLTRDTQLPVDEAVRLAREVADALSVAHGQNVVHRDIKPENILLQGGHALVADFGIALAVQHAGGQRMTQTGLSLGTPQYMSPEQAMGERTVDHRADIYALGAVTYEMLTGDPPFTGSSVQAVVAKVLSAEPERPTLVRRTIPPAVEAAVLTALAKLPADRFASAAEFATALGNPNAVPLRAQGHSALVPARRRWGVLAAGAAAVGIAAMIGGVVAGRATVDFGSVGAEDVVRASLDLGDSAAVRPAGNLRLAISPSGRRIVYIGPDGASSALWLRELDSPLPRKLPDTRGAFAPFFSPDGQSIGYFVPSGIGGNVALKLMSLNGGVAQTVVQDSVAGYGGGDWGDDGRIYFTHASRGLAYVPQSGGAVTKVSIPDSASGMTEHDFPDVLPGSRLALVSLWGGSAQSNRIGVVDLRTGVMTDLMAGTFVRHMPGYLAFGTAGGQVLVAPFDARKGRMTGTPVAILDGVELEMANATMQFALSETGTIVYQRTTGSTSRPIWVDRAGAISEVDTTLTDLSSIALSPDGSAIAMARTASGDNQIWVKRLGTGSVSRISFDVTNANRPTWTPDGRQVAFIASRNARRTAFVRRADGSDGVQAATPGNTRLDEISYHPLGGHVLLRTEGTSPGSRKLLLVTPGVDTIPRVLVQSRYDNFAMSIAPGGRWLAYASNESGVTEVYVRPFPNVDSARFVISVGGGREPLWSRDGTELFFRTVRGEMMSVPVSVGSTFSHGLPRVLFSSTTMAQDEFHRGYDVHPDGQRFLMVSAGSADATQLHLIFNWRRELERAVGRAR